MSRRPEGLPLGAIAHPRLALALGFLITLALAPGLGRLRLATDGRALVPPADPVLALDHEVERRFGLRDSLLVVIRSRHPDGIFNTATLQRLERLTRALQALPELGAEHVVSLATEHSPRFGARGFDYLPFLEPPPESPERLAEVREEVAATDLFRGTLVAEDGRSTAILVGVPPPTAASAADRAELYHRIEALARPFASAEDSLEVVGAPAAEALLGEHILADLRVLVPLAVGMIALVLWLTCSGGWGAGIGLLKMGAALAATLGLIGWLGEPLYLTTAVTPVILVSIGLADEIHLLWEYRQRRGRGEAREAALAGTFQALTRPVILTSLTTAAGFLSFATSSIRPVASFGLATGFGVLFCLGWALTVTPALLALAPQRAFADARVAHGSAAWAERWARALLRRRRLALAALAAASLGLGLGLSRLEAQDGWIDNFSPASAFRQATERVDRDYGGTHVLRLVVSFDPPAERIPRLRAASGPLLAPEVIAALGRVEAELGREPGVGKVLGIHGHLLTTAFLWGAGHEETRRIVPEPAWIYLYLRRIANVRGPARLAELVDREYQSTVITLLLRHANFRQTAALVRRIRELEGRELAPVFGRVELAGDVAVSQAMIPAIVRTQLVSLGLALLANWLLLAAAFRSARLGLLAVVPTVLSVAWTFGLMGWVGVGLGVATSVFSAITLGIGVDYAIHLLERWRSACEGGCPEPAVVALVEAGPAIVIDTLAIVLGFGLLLASQVPTDHRLGLLIAAALSAACLLTLAGLGSMLPQVSAVRARSSEK